MSLGIQGKREYRKWYLTCLGVATEPRTCQGKSDQGLEGWEKDRGPLTPCSLSQVLKSTEEDLRAPHT